MFKTIL